jgi:hypothetical protein
MVDVQVVDTTAVTKPRRANSIVTAKKATTTMTASQSALLIFTSGFGLLCTTLLQAWAIEGYPLEQLGAYVGFAAVLLCWLANGMQRTILNKPSFD